MIGKAIGGRYAAAVMLALLIGIPEHAGAGTCTISSSGMDFGNYQTFTFPGEVTSTTVTSTAIVSMDCSTILFGGDFTISLGPSTVGDGDRISTRYLLNNNGGPHMAFNIYLDGSYSTIWGDGSTGSVIRGTIALGESSHSYTVYGRIPAGQTTLSPGSFSDVLTMTLIYNP